MKIKMARFLSGGHFVESMAYKIVPTESFEDDFEKLDKIIQKRIVEKIKYLAENPYLAEKARYAPKDLEGICKYRVGDWRVLFWINHHNETLTLYGVDHRGKVYRKL